MGRLKNWLFGTLTDSHEGQAAHTQSFDTTIDYSFFSFLNLHVLGPIVCHRDSSSSTSSNTHDDDQQT